MASSDWLLHTDAFDYNVQKRLGPVTERDSLGKGYLGRLRLQLLYADRVLLTDAQLFHTLFFSDLGVETVYGKDLLRHIPSTGMEIRARTGSLEGALVSMVTNGGADGKLFGFSFTQLDEHNYIKRELQNYPSGGVTTWRDVTKALTTITADVPHLHDRVKRAASAWEYWISQEKLFHNSGGERGLKVLGWPKPEDYNFGAVFRTTLLNLRPTIEQEITTPYGTESLRWLDAMSRGELAAEVNSQQAMQTVSDEELRDLLQIEYYFNLCYNGALAQQHKASLQETTDFPETDTVVSVDEDVDVAIAVRDLGATDDGLETGLPIWLVRALTQMPSGTFERLREDLSFRRYEWRSQGQAPALEDMSRKIVAKAREFGMSRGDDPARDIPKWVYPTSMFSTAGLGSLASAVMETATKAFSIAYLGVDERMGEFLGKSVGGVVPSLLPAPTTPEPDIMAVSSLVRFLDKRLSHSQSGE